MAANSKIEWCDHTFNPWVGCTKVSPGCDHCYAEAQMTRRKFVEWGPHAARRRTSDEYWKQPLRWNRAAEIRFQSWDEFQEVNPGLSDTEMEARGFIKPVKPKVFCASLADVFDNQIAESWRHDLWWLIAQTPYLDWLILTKRPQNIAKMLPDPWSWAPPWGTGWPNVGFGTTVENQDEADRRIPHLLSVPAVKRFLSCEPLLGPLDLEHVKAPMHAPEDEHEGWVFNCLETGSRYERREIPYEEVGDLVCWDAGDGPYRETAIDWIICGGESGPNARPMHPNWARSLRDQCANAGVSFFFKQWGEWTSISEVEGAGIHHHFPDGATVRRVGKSRAGATLDGREHREFPA